MATPIVCRYRDCQDCRRATRQERRSSGSPVPEGRNTMNRLDGKVAFISGAARGIGAATARLMVEAGAKVAIGDVLDERGRETARAIAGAGDAAMYQHLDVTREEDWTAAIAATVARFGGLDILVNNAGLRSEERHRGGEPR